MITISVTVLPVPTVPGPELTRETAYPKLTKKEEEMACRPCQENREKRELEQAKLRESTDKKAYTVVEAIKDVVTGNARYTTDEIQQSRTSVCLDCDKYNSTFKACNECKCIVASKVKFAQSSCPLKKWTAVTQ